MKEEVVCNICSLSYEKCFCYIQQYLEKDIKYTEIDKTIIENEMRAVCNKFVGGKINWDLLRSELEIFFFNLIDNCNIRSYRFFVKSADKYSLLCYLFIQYFDDDFFTPYTLELKTS